MLRFGFSVFVLIMSALPAHADFSKSFFIRQELVRTGVLSSPARHKSGEEFTYRICCSSQAISTVRIISVDANEVHYTETWISMSTMQKFEGWLNVKTGQLNKFIEDGNLMTPQPRAEIQIKSFQSLAQVKTPLGDVPATMVSLGASWVSDELIFSEQSPGIGLISENKDAAISSLGTEWMDYH